MGIQALWLTRGYFDFSTQEPPSMTQQIRDQLCAALGRPSDGLRIASYPVGPVWRHTFWWREGESDYAEAQFFLQIAQDYPVLSIGISVEKGFETSDIATAAAQRLDRRSWDWQRLVESAAAVLESDVPDVAAGLEKQPVTVRFHVLGEHGPVLERRAFTLANGHWFERHRGSAGAREIIAHIAALDQHQDRWVIGHFAVDLAPSTSGGMSAGDVAQLLLRFEPVRRRLRGAA